MQVKIVKLDRNINWGAKDARTGKFKPKYDNCADKWVPGLDKKTGVLKTGLTEKEAKEFEKKIGLEDGSLMPNGKYWEDFMIIIPQDGLVIDTSGGPTEEIKYKALMADPTVAKSIEEARVKAGAEYMITSEQAEAKEKNVKRNIIAKAYATFAKMTQTEIREALYMLGKAGERFNDDTDPEVCQDRLGVIVENDPAKFISVVGDKNFKEKVWVLKLLKAGIVRKHGVGTGTNQPLYFEDILLGSNLDEAVDFLKAKENQNIYIGLQKALEAE